MKAKINFKIIFSLVLILFLLNACERKGLDEPLPFGPSSFTVLLNVSASPNVIIAGTTRGSSTITATLKRYDKSTQTYNPETNKTIVFGIYDAVGSKINAGYFEGYKSVAARVTNTNGVAQVTYYGPLETELLGNIAVNIWGTVAAEGSESISEWAPVDIVGRITCVTLSVSASPTSISAGTTRETSIIAATLKAVDGTPMAYKTIRFDICDDAEEKIYIGYFEGDEIVKRIVTGANGVAQVTYYGPLATELPGLEAGDSTTAFIRATTTWIGGESTSSMTPIYITRVE